MLRCACTVLFARVSEVLQDSTHSAGSLTPVLLSGWLLCVCVCVSVWLIGCTQARGEYLMQHGAEPEPEPEPESES